jgi:signal transduction histidine kinase
MGEAILNAVHEKRLLHPIESDVPTGIMAVADFARLETIIGHLVQNAIEASDDGAPVKIRCKLQDDFAVISIQDSGVGMTEKFVAEELFKPFVSTKEGGFGIGAYEARTLAISMNGNLRVESRIGKGTTFTLSLPTKSTSEYAEIEEAA